MLPYNAPVKLYEFAGETKIVDQQNREVFSLYYTSRDIIYVKKMKERIQFLVELLNGSKQVQYSPDSKSYDLFESSNSVTVVSGNGEPKQDNIINKVVEAVKRGRGRPKKSA